jgi:ribosomal protein S8
LVKKMDHSITFILAAIKTGLINRNFSITVPFKSLTVGFLNLLYKEGYINGYIPFRGERKKI